LLVITVAPTKAIVHDRRCDIEAHGCSAAQIVLWPAGSSTSGEGKPGSVYRVSKLLWRVGSQKRLGLVAESVEDKGNLNALMVDQFC
jgi:hypothetical protein